MTKLSGLVMFTWFDFNVCDQLEMRDINKTIENSYIFVHWLFVSKCQNFCSSIAMLNEGKIDLDKRKKFGMMGSDEFESVSKLYDYSHIADPIHSFRPSFE